MPLYAGGGSPQPTLTLPNLWPLCSDSTPRELCLGFGTTGINCIRWKTSRCRIVDTPQWLDEWFHRYWIINPPPKVMLKKVKTPLPRWNGLFLLGSRLANRLPAALLTHPNHPSPGPQEPKFNGRNRPLSGGFSATMLAMSVCGEVDLYGFSGGGGSHYYQKLTAVKDGCTPFNIHTGKDTTNSKGRRNLLAASSVRRRGTVTSVRVIRHSQRPGGPKKTKEQKRCAPPKHWALKHFFRTEAHGTPTMRLPGAPAELAPAKRSSRGTG